MTCKNLLLLRSMLMTLVIGIATGYGTTAEAAKGGNAEAARYLIQYSSGNGAALKEVIRANGGTVVFDYAALIDGLAADLSAAGMKAVRRSGLATTIEADGMRTLHGGPSGDFVDNAVAAPAPDAIPAGFPNGTFDEFVPWGRDRVQADIVWSETPNFGAADNGIAEPNVRDGAVTGAGVIVGVLDSGIDYDHEDLADNILDLRGDGVIRDFLDGDPDPEDSALNGHGTSVASVSASVDNTVGLIGVAPGARISPYRVCDVQCPLSAIIGGLVQSVADGVDVINMSFGGPAGFNIEASAVQAANRQGVVLVASAGNDGSQKVQFPAGYDTVLAVGATDINDAPAGFTNVGGWVDVTGPGVSNPTATCSGCVIEAILDEVSPTAQSFSPNAMTGTALAGVANTEIVDVGRACVATAGDTLAADPAGKVALIIRGACSFAEKVFFAEQAGAIGTVIYNQNPGNFFGTLGAFQAAGPSVSISNAEGVALAAEIAGGTTTVDLSVLRNPAILYNFISGTSFSGPHVAGVAALVRSVNPGLSPIQVRKIIEMTAEPIGPKVIFGNGMVRADSAVQAAQ
jgi:subtilisin family serine protease